MASTTDSGSNSNPDILPSYNALFPEDGGQANTVINGRRRYTTITLREIYYPSGCPCHPKEDPKTHKKGKCKQQPHHLSYDLINESQPEQREEFQQQRVRRFEILKSTPLGLVYPQNLRLGVVDVDDDKGTDATGFVTTEMKWWKVQFVVPPMFEIYPSSHPANEVTYGLDQHKRRRSSSETAPAPSSSSAKNDRAEPYPVAKVEFPHVDNLWKLTVDMTLYHITPAMHFDPTATTRTDDAAAAAAHSDDLRTRWAIKQIRCLGRQYSMTCTNPGGRNGSNSSYMWRSRPKAEILNLPGVDDGHPAVNGNLVLEDPDGRIVAVYKQRRDFKVMGALTIFLDTLEPMTTTTTTDIVSAQGQQPSGELEPERAPRPTVEAVVASTLAVVLFERISFRSLVGK
ncbi:hypothetical protein KCU88_g4587, partial [Aureobasidium melanogenum]